MTTPQEFLTDFCKDIIKTTAKDGDPMERQPLVKGYARHLAARDSANRAEEVRMAINTYKDNPELFLEIAEARLAEFMGENNGTN